MGFAVRLQQEAVQWSSWWWKKASFNMKGLWSGLWQCFGKPYPEPPLCARPGVIAQGEEAQNGWKRLFHGLVLDWNEPFVPSTWIGRNTCFRQNLTWMQKEMKDVLYRRINMGTRWEAERKLCLKVTSFAVEVFVGNHHHHLLAPAQSVLR